MCIVLFISRLLTAFPLRKREEIRWPKLDKPHPNTYHNIHWACRWAIENVINSAELIIRMGAVRSGSMTLFKVKNE